MELYIGLAVSFLIFVGFPAFSGMIIKFLNYKFCEKFDEEKEARLGGMTILEIFTYILTCGNSLKGRITEEQKFL
jgi:hypothetical protein